MATDEKMRVVIKISINLLGKKKKQKKQKKEPFLHYQIRLFTTNLLNH